MGLRTGGLSLLPEAPPSAFALRNMQHPSASPIKIVYADFMAHSRKLFLIPFRTAWVGWRNFRQRENDEP